MQVVKIEEVETTQMESSTILHINSVGAIIDNHLLLFAPERSLIGLDSIQKAEIHKTRSYIRNLFCLVCALPLLYSLITYHFTMLEKILIVMIMTLMLVFAFTIKKLKYIMLIRKFDLNFIEIEVNEFCKEDAKEIVRAVNKKIKLSRVK